MHSPWHIPLYPESRPVQATRHAAPCRAAVFLAAALCAAFIPYTTKPCTAGKLAEFEHAVSCPPQWRPVLLGSRGTPDFMPPSSAGHEKCTLMCSSADWKNGIAAPNESRLCAFFNSSMTYTGFASTVRAIYAVGQQCCSRIRWRYVAHVFGAWAATTISPDLLWPQLHKYGREIYYQPIPSFVGHNWNSAMHYAVMETMVQENKNGTSAVVQMMLQRCFRLRDDSCIHGIGHGIGQLTLRDLGYFDSVCARFRPKSRLAVLSSPADQRSFLTQSMSVLQMVSSKLTLLMMSQIAQGFFEHFFMIARVEPTSWWQSCAAINDTLMSASCFGQGLQWVAMMPFRSSSSRLAHRDELVSALAARPYFLSKINFDSILRAWTEEGAETPTPWPPSHTEG